MIGNLIDLLCCPICAGTLHELERSAGLECTSCGARYPTHLGIPILLPPELQEAGTDSGELAHKRQQMAFFDQESADDFGITRPHGAPELYGWTLRERFRRSVSGLEELLPGATALTICGGSGVDADFLSQAGARVILSDISLGVVLQARERVRRFGLDVGLVVADAENLPFRDASIDLVYVHDGLHHLERPMAGVAEMSRVARRAVAISEPSSATATALAVRLGLAEDQEEAGNRVRRLTLEEIESELTQRGFRTVRAERFAMLYRHWPGRAMRVFSTPLLLPVAKLGLNTLNRTVGRYGNKLAVQAVRAEPE